MGLPDGDRDGLKGFRMSSIEALFSAASKARLSAYAPIRICRWGALATIRGQFSPERMSRMPLILLALARKPPDRCHGRRGQRRIAEILIVGEAML